MRRLRSELHRTPLEHGIGVGDVHRLAGQRAGRVGRHLGAGGEAPGAALEDSYPQPVAVGVRDRGEVIVARREVLPSQPHQPDIRVRRARAPGSEQGGVGDVAGPRPLGNPGEGARRGKQGGAG